MSVISLPDVLEMRCFCVVSFSRPRNNWKQGGKLWQETDKGFLDFDIFVSTCTFINLYCNKQGLPDYTF